MDLRRPYLEWKFRPWHSHRERVGGLWDELAEWQDALVKDHGWRPRTRLLDLGCGSLRYGRIAIQEGLPGTYVGVDAVPQLIKRGRRWELPRGLERVKRPVFRVSATFDLDGLGVFDMVLAQSLWTHLPLSDVVASIEAVVPVLAPGGVLVATFFEAPEGAREYVQVTPNGSFVTHQGCNPYHLSRETVERLLSNHGLRCCFEERDHPRGQVVVVARRGTA